MRIYKFTRYDIKTLQTIDDEVSGDTTEEAMIYLWKHGFLVLNIEAQTEADKEWLKEHNIKIKGEINNGK